MALIGNQLSSAENNSYRVLDNLASFTLTFDGSSSSNILASTDTINLSQHPFITGQRVTYSSGGGSPIGGLLSGTAYYITKIDQNSFKLATSYVNAITNVNIDLVGTGTGITHSFNVAFDGINTKFKATYNNGTKCTISRAAQLDIAINGVIQQPYDSNPPPNGFTIEADATIVFSTAPLAGYTFWGKALSGATASFETSDNSIDNFTGNGSTTNFTLSKTPINSQNILVDINGVTQYPSDATGTRAYSVNANVLAFTAPPANGSLIQVRYIGFAGATSSSVTGFYGRTGNVVLNTSDNVSVGTILVGSATSTGITGQVLQATGGAYVSGSILIGSATSTGTAGQVLQATGGSYFSGSVGIGTTNPQTKLQVDGVLGFGATNNVKIGDNTTGSSITSGISNIFIGPSAGNFNNTGSANIFLGPSAGYNNQGGVSNVIIGNAAGYSNTGSSNVFFGLNTGLNNSSGSSNSFIGVAAGISNQTGSNNVFLGARNGISASASYKVIIGSGYLANYFDSPNTTKDAQFAVGVRTDANASKYWLVGDENFNIGIGTTNPSQKLEVVGGEIKAGRVDASQEGGQFSLARSTDNATAWYMDVYGNTSTPVLRFVDVSTASVRAGIDSSGNFQFNSGYGSAATAYGCRAWVNYNGSTPAIRSSGNVSSVTRNGTCDYTINFTTSMPDANYTWVGNASQGNQFNIVDIPSGSESTYPTVSSLRINTPGMPSTSPPIRVLNTNPVIVTVAIFR